MRYANFERNEYPNKHGHPQTHDEDDYEVCSQCGAFYTNFGLGVMCDTCRHDFEMECNACEF